MFNLIKRKLHRKPKERQTNYTTIICATTLDELLNEVDLYEQKVIRDCLIDYLSEMTEGEDK